MRIVGFAGLCGGVPFLEQGKRIELGFVRVIENPVGER
jgi:hypothetical protein